MESKNVIITLKMREYHLKRMVRCILEAGVFEEFFEGVEDNKYIKDALVYLAETDETGRVRCAAINLINDKTALKEIASSNTFLVAREAAKKRLREL